MPGPPTAKRNKDRKRTIRQAELREMHLAARVANNTIRAWLYLRERIRQKLLGGATIEDGKLLPHVDATEEQPTAAEITDLLREPEAPGKAKG